MLTALLGALAWSSGAAHAAPAATVPLRLMAINDFHGHLEPGNLSLTLADPQRPETSLKVATGGAAALAGLVQQLRAQVPNSLLISSGDLIGAAPLVSTLFRHEPTIEAANALGVDLGAVGNHEFDAGLAELQRLGRGGCAPQSTDQASSSCALAPFAGARFPLLAANVLDAQGRPVFAPAVVRRVGGVKVGFIGAVTRSTPGIVMPSGIAGLRFGDEAEAINRSAARLLAQGVRTLVAVVHEGGEIGPPSGTGRADWNDPSCPGARGPIFEIERRLRPEVGVLLSAHTHQGYRCVIGQRLVMQATSYGRGLAVADLQLDRRSGRLLAARTVSANLPVFNAQSEATARERLSAALPAPYAQALRQAVEDPALAALVQRYAEAAAPRARQVIGQLASDIGRQPEAGAGDSPAGRLVADAQLAATRAPDRGGAQIALTNRGGLRSDLLCRGTPPCELSFGALFTLQPFGNSLVVMSLSGAQLKALLESQRRPAGTATAFLQPSAGLSYDWSEAAPAGQQVQNLRLDGQAIEPERLYRVTVNSFLAEGGDGFALLTQGRERLGGAQDLDALVEHVRATARVQPDPEARVRLLP